MARTINSPGVEIFERDESETSSLQAGTNILVQGFAHQGPTNELIRISSKDELNQVYFGGNGPTNDAERFFYHSCAEILNSPANLYTIRLPYGLSDGEGFSGKYVALAYGGQVMEQQATKIVTRSVVIGEDFVPEDTPLSTSNEIDLYEFSARTIKEDDPETGVYYTLISGYVKNELGEDWDESIGETPFKYASQFPLNDEHFWVNTASGQATAIDISVKDDSYAPKYKYDTYVAPSDGYEFRIPVASAILSGESASSDVDFSNLTWTDLDASACPKAIFKNVGVFTQKFADDVLNKAIDAYTKDGDPVNNIHPLNAIDNLYVWTEHEDSKICYKIDYGKTLNEWKTQITTQSTASETTLQTEIKDINLVGVYTHVDGERVNTKDMIVDTEKIGDTIIESIKRILPEDGGAFTENIVFENGFPLTDKETMSLSYDGPLTVEAISRKTRGKRYSIGVYANKLITNRIKTYDFEEGLVDKTTGKPIMENVLTINPVPLAVPLTEYQYAAIQEGAIKWSDITYDLNGEGTGEDAFRTILGKSAFPQR